MQKEAGVHPGVPLGDRGAVHPRQPWDKWPDHVLGRGKQTLDVDAGLDAEPVEGRGEHLGGTVAGTGAQGAEGTVDLPSAGLVGEHGVGHPQ